MIFDRRSRQVKPNNPPDQQRRGRRGRNTSGTGPRHAGAAVKCMASIGDEGTAPRKKRSDAPNRIL